MRQTMNIRALMLAIAISLWLWCPPARGEEAPPRTIDPTRYTSPSGEYVLIVDPDDKYGEGAASYRLTYRHGIVWSGRRSFTLLDAGVTDTGVVGGYAYPGSWTGSNSYFEAIIFDRSGKPRLDERTRRTLTGFAGHAPTALCLCLNPAQDRMLIFQYVHDIQTYMPKVMWWQYSLSTGKRLKDFDPKALDARIRSVESPRAASAVPGVPLTLLNWEDDNDAWFALIDTTFTVVWTRKFPNDYRVNYADRVQAEALDEIVDGGTILPSPGVRKFAIRSLAQQRRLTFAVLPTANGTWKVSEISRKSLPAIVPPLPRMPTVALKRIGQFDLHGAAVPPPSAIHGVSAFTIAGANRIAFLRDTLTSHPSLVVTDTTGTSAQATPLPAKVGYRWWGPNLLWLGGSRYVMGVARDDHKPEIWLADTRTHIVKEIPGSVCDGITALAALPGGSFAVLDNDAHIIIAYSNAGKILWRHHIVGDETLTARSKSKKTGTEDDCCNGVGLVPLSGGRLGLINANNTVVWRYSGSTGRYLGTLAGDTEWIDHLSSDAPVITDGIGGFLALEDEAPAHVLRIGADGVSRTSLTLVGRDGATIEPHRRGVQRAGDGTLWMIDQGTLCGFDEHGVLKTVLGRLPNPRRLTEATTVMVVDPLDRITTVDRFTTAVHVFGPHGEYLHPCLPDKDKFSEYALSVKLAESQAGDLYVTDRYSYRDLPIIHFSPTGKKLGSFLQHAGRNEEHINKTPAHALGWYFSIHDVHFVDVHGEVRKTIARRPDMRWLQYVRGVYHAMDGSFAVLDYSLRFGDYHVSLYSADGTPRHTFAIPRALGFHTRTISDNIAYNGHLVVVATNGSLYGISPKGRFLWRFTPKSHGSANQPFFTDHGRTLTVWTEGTHFERYAMP